MATTLLSIGYPQVMVQNQIYALPAARCLLFTDTAAATIEQENDTTFASGVALTLASGQAEVAGGFIRCTSGNINVVLKKA